MSRARIWCVLIIAALVNVAAHAEALQARLSSVPIDGRNRAQVTGSGQAEAELDGSRLTVSGSFAGLQGAATTASVHMSTHMGVRGPAIFEVAVTPAMQGSVSASLTLTAEQTEAFRSGRLYLLISSQSAPDGNLWGWFAP